MVPLEFQVHKKLVGVAAASLELVEELQSAYNDAQLQLLDSIKFLPIEDTHKKLIESIVFQGNVFTPNRINFVRKKIFDHANSESRNLMEEFKKYKITL